jgi:hypothetical protein
MEMRARRLSEGVNERGSHPNHRPERISHENQSFCCCNSTYNIKQGNESLTILSFSFNNVGKKKKSDTQTVKQNSPPSVEILLSFSLFY